MLSTLGAEVVHPGEVLWRVYMQPHGVSQNQLARWLGLPPRCVNEIVHGKRAITARTALLLARVYGGDGMDWLERQALWDLDQARRALGQRRSRRRRNGPELARRERVSRSRAAAAASREVHDELHRYMKAHQIGAYKPGYGLAVPGDGGEPSDCDRDAPSDREDEPPLFPP